MLSGKDLKQLADKGITETQFQTQIENFEKGFPFANLAGAATVGDGIVHFTEVEAQEYATLFDQQKDNFSMTKFVPASGAASRMFKDLIDFEQKYDASDKKIGFAHMLRCMENVSLFAFAEELEKVLQKDDYDLKRLVYEKNYSQIARYILSEQGLDYQHKPKAMLLFHRYANEVRTAFEEHLVEAAAYATNVDKTVRMHFTISPEHKSMFVEKMQQVVPKWEERLGVRYIIDFTEQMSKTDMVALDKKGCVVRNADGSILFRPGGHGALIENLNALESDLIFIKNIDNVTTDSLRPTTYLYKKALAGYLLHIQQAVYECLHHLESLSVNEASLSQIEGFAAKMLNIRFSMTYFSRSMRERVSYLARKLNRPIRVCGMVKNEGEPGGGPYWVRNQHGHKSLQIIESSQIDFNNRFQVDMVKESSHFNPVDLICAVRNYKGNKFNLKNYIDKNTGFISKKKQNGIDMTIQELPGLWNGAMADWNTIFVEVPIETFTPVKTIEDLLRKEHQ